MTGRHEAHRSQATDASFVRSLSLLERAALSRRAGLTFQGARDVSGSLGYLDNIAYADYLLRFERNGIATRMVDVYPKATWKGGAQLVEDDNPEVVTAFEAAWAELEQRLKIWSVLRRADVISGVGHYGVVLIGAPGVASTELPRLRAQDILYLSVYGEGDARIESLVVDAKSPRYALPDAYTLTRRQPLGAGSAKVPAPLRVHHTRVLHVAEGLLDDEVYAQPRLKAGWNRLDDLDKVAGGGSEAFWLRAHPGYTVSFDKEMDPPPSQAEIDAARTHAEEFAHSLRRTVAARGIEFEAVGAEVANFDKQVESLLSLLSASCSPAPIPKRLLLGSEMGELASSQDKHNFDGRVMDRRLDFAGPWVVRPLVDRLVAQGALPEPAQYDVWWPEILNLDEEQRAKVAESYARANQANGEPIITTDEIRDRILDLPPIEEVADIDELEADTGLAPEVLRGIVTAKLWLGRARGRWAPRTSQVRVAARPKKKARRALSIVPPTGTSGSSGA